MALVYMLFILLLLSHNNSNNNNNNNNNSSSFLILSYPPSYHTLRSPSSSLITTHQPPLSPSAFSSLLLHLLSQWRPYSKAFTAAAPEVLCQPSSPPPHCHRRTAVMLGTPLSSPTSYVNTPRPLWAPGPCKPPCFCPRAKTSTSGLPSTCTISVTR